MVPTLRKAFSRISQMDWDELKTRAQQSANKRLDLAKYRMGLPAIAISGNHRPAWGQFLFASEDLPVIASLLRKHLPDEIEGILHEAREICEHRFTLLGYKNLDFGEEIDWHLDKVHGKRAPLWPWFKIPFLNFSVVGDHKVTWELNRHQHLVTLAKAWVLEHEPKYAVESIDQWYAWQRANPYPVGINWCSSLEVAFRSLSWLWMRSLLAGCPAVPAGFNSDLQLALALNARHIERYLSTYFSPNTHLLGEAVALFFIGTLCPEIRDAERWRDRGWRIILQEAQRQVRKDGVYFEQSLYYHVYALDLLLHACALAKRNQVEVPSALDAVLGKMLDFIQALAQAGPPHSFGDDDGGRVFNPRRNRCEHLTDPLAIGAVLLGRHDLRSSVPLTEEAVWLFAGQGASNFVTPCGYQKPKTVAFAAGGIYVMASSSGCPQQLGIDSGPLGAGSAGHGHADALSVTVSLDGHQWLVDPGTFGYISDNANRARFRGTSAHNTLRVDGLDQAVAHGPFSWTALPSVLTKRWRAGETFSLFEGSHSGYSRLPDPVVHSRFVFHLHGEFWLVRDVINGREVHHVESYWHFAQDLRVEDRKNSFLAYPVDCAAKSARLALLKVPNSAWNCEVGSGEVSRVYGKSEPAPLLRMHAHLQLPAENAVLIRPLLHQSDQPGELNLLDAGHAGFDQVATGYSYGELNPTHYMIFGKNGMSWTLGSWESDAEFIYCQIRDGELVRLILCDATFVRLKNRPVVTAPRRVEQFEWLKQAGKEHIFTSDHDTIKFFSSDALHSTAVVV